MNVTHPKKDRTTDYRQLEESSPTFQLKRRILRRVLDEIAPHPLPRVWDAGCGAGTLSEILAGRAEETILLTDIERSSVDMARERLRESDTARPVRLEGEVFDLQAGRPPAGEFDLVLCWAVLEHLADDTAGAAALAASMRPGGRLIVNVPLHPRLFNQLDRLEDHHRRYTRRSLCALLTHAGLVIERFRTFGFPVLLATKILWAPLARHESSVSASPVSRTLAPFMAGIDYGFYRAGVPWGVEALVVSRRPELSAGRSLS